MSGFLVDVDRFDEANVFVYVGLHAVEVRVEGGLEQILQRHDTLPDDGVFVRREFNLRIKDIHQEKFVVGRAVADCAGVAAEVGNFAFFGLEGMIDLRGHEVFTTAQHERSDGSRVGDRSGRGEVRHGRCGV